MKAFRVFADKSATLFTAISLIFRVYPLASSSVRDFLASGSSLAHVVADDFSFI